MTGASAKRQWRTNKNTKNAVADCQQGLVHKDMAKKYGKLNIIEQIERRRQLAVVIKRGTAKAWRMVDKIQPCKGKAKLMDAIIQADQMAGLMIEELSLDIVQLRCRKDEEQSHNVVL